MPRKQSKSSGDSVAAARPSRRCCAVASECTPKLCVACKLGGLKDVFACRETLGHVAPNWDAPDAGAFFADGAVAAAEAKALADASSVVPDRSAPKKRKAPAAKAKAKAPTAAKASADAPAPPAPAPRQAKLARTAGRWLREDGSLDDAALVRDIGGEKAPILRYDETYADDKPIRESMRVAEFVDSLLRDGGGATFEAPRLVGLEPDLLVHWLERTRGASPLQYLFMGSGGTNSKLHVDPGGLDLVIAPLVGWKEVTLVHREDAELVGAMCDDDALGDAGEGSSDDESAAAPADDDLRRADERPLGGPHRRVGGAAPGRPGECLVMPQGTLHAVRNLTPALSYHRFHLDTANLSGFWRALVDGDCSGIRPAEILWNGTHGSMKALDAFDDDVEKLNRRAGRSYDGFDWPALLADVDDALAHWRAESRGFARPASPRAVASASRCLPDAFDEKSARGGAKGDRPKPRVYGCDYEPAPGDVVVVTFHAKQVRARVVAAEPKPKKGGKPKFARVHYDTYAKKYDELVRVADLAPPDGASRVALAVGARVKVPWGTGRELYEAEIAGVHGGGACKRHYLTIGGDWDQWVTRTKIIRKLKERA
ncbi:hypothetical protein JL721_2003 [Aureococcus anophagefferens]|nr:hypothetical protein JL721_2003 [Aureococcus anophagefferens]